MDTRLFRGYPVQAMRTSIPCRFRSHGASPASTVLVHGGPGAAGSLRLLARDLAEHAGVLEPLLLAPSLEGQLAQLRWLITTHLQPPAALVGHSFGAMLGLVLAARDPSLVSRLVLVGSGVLEEHQAGGIMDTRLSRLAPAERAEARHLKDRLAGSFVTDTDLSRFGALLSRADGYDLIPDTEGETSVDATVFRAVWPEMAALRSSGELLELAASIICPVLALHGDHDPHPVEGVCAPLSLAVPGFRCITLERCGHEPWRERHAKEHFLALLLEEMSGSSG